MSTAAMLEQVFASVSRLQSRVLKLAQHIYRRDAEDALTAAGRTARLPLAFRSQCGEDLLIWEAFGGKLDGFYIEVGAFDGVSLSVTYAFEAIGWRGLLIEAIPQRAEACRQSRPNSRVVHAALGPRGSKGTVEFTVVDDSYGGMYSYTKAAPDHLKMIASQRLRKSTVSVPYTSMDDVLAEHSGPIDVAVLDVEGAEADLLRGFDLLKHRPTLLIIEDNTGGQDHSLNAVMSVMPYRLAGWVGPNRAYVRADANDVFDRARAFLQ
jgi:FkbM family methyltransferase